MIDQHLANSTRKAKAVRYMLASVALVATLATVWLAWKDLLSPRLIPKRFGTVIDHTLYRSGRIRPSLLPKVLDKYGIDDIVTLTYPVDTSQYQRVEQRFSATHDIHLQRFPLEGNGTGDPANVVDALVAIHAAIARGDQVLVHCAAGTERTGGVIYLYQTLVLGEPPDRAYAELLDYGHRPARNPKLEPFLNANMVYFANALVQRGAIRSAPAPLPHLPEAAPR